MSFARTLSSAASIAALVSGCSLITSLDGLTSDDVALTPAQDGGDATTGGEHEAGSPPGDATGGTDAAPIGDDDAALTSDATAPNDASDASDAADTSPPIDATGVDTGPLGYCASLSPAPLFCDDFDESSGFGKWDKVGSNQGTATVSSAVSHSAPNAAVTSSNSLTTNAASLGIEKVFASLTSTPRVNTLAFDVYIEKLDTTHSAVAVVGTLDLIDSTNAIHEFQFVVSQVNGKAVVTFPEYWDPQNGGATGYASHATSATISLKTWTRVMIELSLATSTGLGSTARLYLDGTVVATTSPNVFTKNGAPHPIIGLSYVAAPSDPWVVRYDNVTFNSTP